MMVGALSKRRPSPRSAPPRSELRIIATLSVANMTSLSGCIICAQRVQDSLDEIGAAKDVEWAR
jgi:hypothetical protein